MGRQLLARTLLRPDAFFPRATRASPPAMLSLSLLRARSLAPVPRTRRAFSARAGPPSPPSPPPSRSAVRRAWEGYLRLLETRPLATKVATGAAIGGAGDLLCQLALEGAERADLRRLGIFTAMNGALVSPVLHVWYGFLGAAVPGAGARAVVTRLALDQLGFAPAFVPVFLSTLLLLEGRAEHIPDKLRADWWPTTRANWAVWVPAQAVNLSVVPPPLRVLFANAVGLFWNAYLSLVGHANDSDHVHADSHSLDDDHHEKDNGNHDEL